MDVLSDILDALDLEGTLYFTTEFSAPWGVRVPRHPNVARFHLVMRGTCWIEVAGDPERICLESGDLVLVPHGTEHVLSDPPGTPGLAVDEVVKRSGFTGRGALVFGGEDQGRPTRMLCGHFEFGDALAHPLLEQLPGRMVFRHEDASGHARMDEAFRTIVREIGDARPGSDAVVKRLSEVLFIQSVRAWAERTGQGAGVLAALANPHLGRSLAAIHDAPGRDWTLETLAREAGLSRTVFAEKFQRSLGRTPMQYVAFWRMQRARRLLANPRHTIDGVAAQVGYRSTAAFSRVFKKWAGQSPGSFRRQGDGAG